MTWSFKEKKNSKCFSSFFARKEVWALPTLFFHEKGRGHLRSSVCSWEGETNCLNVSPCETIRLQGCCQGCFWHLAKGLRADVFTLENVHIGKRKNIRIILRNLIKVDKSYWRAISLLIWKRGDGLLPSGPLSLLKMWISMIFWVPWVRFANSQISPWQSYSLKIELQSTVHSVNAQPVSAINSPQQNKNALLLFESPFCSIVWKWNVSKTTFGKDCLFSGQQTESMPVNLSPLPQKHALMQYFYCSAKRFH